MSNLYSTPVDGDPPPVLAADGEPQRGRRRGTKLRWGIGITLAGFLAGGGIAMAATGNSAATAAAGTAAAGTVTAGGAPAGGAAVLNSALTTAAGRTTGRPVAGALRRLRLLGGMHGSFTFRTKTGAVRTLAYERGTIQSDNGSDIVVRAPDGTTWTWLIADGTVVRRGGAKASTSALADGQSVFAGGPVTNGAHDARLIVIRAAKAARPATAS